MYAYANVNAVNIGVTIAKGKLPEFIDAAKLGGAIGCDITTPHKSGIVDYLDECEPISRAFRSVNHVKIQDGKLIGVGLDGKGMGISIERRFGSLKGAKILILGAGAVAGAIAGDVCERGAREICVVNRTRGKAETLVKTLEGLLDVRTRAIGLEADSLNEVAPDVDIVVQTTSIGIASDSEYPLSFFGLLPQHAFFADVHYPNSVFLSNARANGINHIDGSGMLLEQEIALLDFHFGIRLSDDALLEAEEAVAVAVAMRNIRESRKR
jgi:shikimate dehydrogenase